MSEVIHQHHTACLTVSFQPLLRRRCRGQVESGGDFSREFDRLWSSSTQEKTENLHKMGLGLEEIVRRSARQMIQQVPAGRAWAVL